MDKQPAELTEVLEQAVAGDKVAADRLWPLVYDQLRAMAQLCMNSERPNHTLSATALVHEAYLRLIGPRKIPWANQGHFYAAAAEAIRRILLDHAKCHGSQKRSGGAKHEILSVASLSDLSSPEKSAEILALDEAVCRLEQQNPEAGMIVRLRFYAGLSIDETATALGIPARTVDRRWSFARAWLHRQLSDTCD